MPRGYRCILIALVGWLSLAAQHPAQQQRDPAQPAQTEQQPPFAPYEPLSADPCYRSKNHDTADLCAQWRAAFAAEKASKAARDAVTWTIVGTFLSAIALLGLFLTLRQTEQALGEARKGNEISEATAKRELRAYLVPTDQQVVDLATGKRAAFAVNLHNSGQTPAYDVRLVTVVHATTGDPDTERILFREKPKGGTSFSRDVIAGGAFKPHRNRAHTEWDANMMQMVAQNHLKVIFAGIISYRDIFGKRHLSTFRSYLVHPGDRSQTTLDLTTCAKGNSGN